MPSLHVGGHAHIEGSGVDGSGGQEVEVLMSRKINYPLPNPTRTCPHCGLIHYPADLLRIDSNGSNVNDAGRRSRLGELTVHRLASGVPAKHTNSPGHAGAG
jgi:hypothetical protein